MKCLGLDIGSSNIKGAVLDLELGEIGAPRAHPFPAPLDGLAAGSVEIAPAAVETTVRQLLEELLAEAPNAAAVFCSGQMGGVVLVDRARGAPTRALTNYLSWRDQRTLEPHRSGGSYLDAIRFRWNSRELVELGNELQTGSASALLFWLAENGRLPPRAMPATIADFVLARLCHVRPQWDPTQAIGLLDLYGGDWHRGAIEKLGLSDIVWPDLADPRRPIGEARINGRRLACHAALGDQQCACAAWACRAMSLAEYFHRLASQPAHGPVSAGAVSIAALFRWRFSQHDHALARGEVAECAARFAHRVGPGPRHHAGESLGIHRSEGRRSGCQRNERRRIERESVVLCRCPG